jgi:hypothetical protein
MNDELFADLLASAEEMVEIEKGRKAPADAAVHRRTQGYPFSPPHSSPSRG